MKIHPRGDWTTRSPKSTTPLAASEVRGVAIHWLGPAADASDPAKLLRGVQTFHMDRRGWSDIAYNLAVDPKGDLWVLRGLEVRSAANGDAATNKAYVAIVALIGQGQKPTEAMLRGLRQAIALVRRRYPEAYEVRGHQEVRPDGTACPGPDLMHFVRQPVHTGVRPMYDPPIPLEPIVADLACPSGGAWLLAASGAVYAFGGAPYYGAANGQAYFNGRQAARLEARPDGGYTILASSGERYEYAKAS